MGFFGGGGASVDLASPPAIGNTTPNTGAFTTLSGDGLAFRNRSSFIGSNADEVYQFRRSSGGTVRAEIGNGSLTLFSNTAFLSFALGDWPYTPDVIIRRDAAGILGQRDGTNAQICRFYRTFTDASNYERLSLIATRTTRFAIAAENAGTGAARSLEISFYTSASDPTSSDITSGCFSVWKNSGTGTIKLWANDGGTMKSVSLA